MKIHEYQARDILRQYEIPVSSGSVVFSPKEAEVAFAKFANPSCMAKVQVQMGGRGKAGGVIKVESASLAKAFAEKFLNKPFSTYQSAGESKLVRSILITEDISINQEYYLGIVVDRALKKPAILFSKEGGVEIEEVAAKNPSAIHKMHFSPDTLISKEEILKVIKPIFSNESIANQISEIAQKLARFFVDKDASICEINPLVLSTNNRVIALDAKIVFDDNALFRHPEILALKDPDEEDEREKKAKQFGLSYVSMTGNVGCLVNGAGLAMATMDMIKIAGGEPANFLDVGGGATVDQVREAFKIIVEDERVEAILVNIFGGIMKCDVIAQGIIEASRQIELSVPLVVRLEGTRVEEGRKLLKESGLKIISCLTIREAAATAVEKSKEHRKTHVHSR